VAELAEAQHGVVGAWQLREMGMSRSAIASRVGRGELLRLYRGVYAVGYRPLIEEGRWMAAVLAGGPDAVLSHRSAGVLWGIVPRRPLVPEVIRPRKFGPVEAMVGHRMALRADEMTEVEGIPATTAARAVFDLAAVATPREVERAFHELEVRRLWGPVSVRGLVERYPGHRGVGVLRILLASRKPVGITRNEFEEAFVAVLDAHGFPMPRFNATISVRGRFFEADALWDRERFLAELDGSGAHQANQAFHSDRKRDRILLAEGWRTSRITWHQLRDEPAEVAADLRLALHLG
jgi:very-short-patch-repair endonuclease